MENALEVIGKSPADLAELMGMSNAPAKSTSALAEMKQVHQNVMGTKEVDGEAMEVAIVKAGAFSVTFPDDTVYYSDTITIPLCNAFSFSVMISTIKRPDGGKDECCEQ